MKKITLLFILMVTSLGFSQNNVTVSGTAAWTGYANVFDLNGTDFLFGNGWALADIKTVVTPATNTLTLYPNFNTYTDALNGSANDIAYWTNGAGLGNKIFEGNSFVENSALAGQILTFTGNVTSNNLASGYTAVAFIKGLNPATNYSADVNVSVPLVSGQPFSVTTTTAIPAGLIVQYGFTVKGLNGNPANEVALGKVVVTATAASNPTEPVTAAPTPPVRNASDVVSIYSNAYANVTLDELPTSWSETTFSTLQIQGNDTWKSIGEFLGMVTNYANGVDLSTMEKMHIDYWTTDNNPIGVKIVNTVNGGEALGSLGTTATGSWQSIDIDMSAFAALPNKTKITQLLIDPTGPSTIYIDNFYFWKAPAAPTFTPLGTWKMKPQAVAMAVGPTQGSALWWSNGVGELTTRACFFDDTYVFNADGSFSNVLGADTWLETWQGVAAEACGTPVNPHNGSNPATYVYNSTANTITLSGVGAYLGLPKATNNGELTSPSLAPASVTYTVTSLDATTMTLDINYGAGWWRFVLEKQALGVNSFEKAKVSIYPNPTSDIVTVSADSVIENISIYNLLGQQMLSLKANSSLETLNISNLQSGIYLVKTTINGKTATSRIVKK
jgi:hypothetical protein